jgi:hypothetical protein
MGTTLMRYRITGQWRLGDAVAPSGVVIDANANDRWSKRVRGLVPPLDAVPLDQAAYEAQLAAYPDHRHLLRGGWR